MNKLVKILGLVFCKKATELADKKIYFGLSKKEEIQLFFHKLSCDACRNYQKQAVLLDKILKEKLSKEKNSEATNLSHDFKLRIIQQIEKQ